MLSAPSSSAATAACGSDRDVMCVTTRQPRQQQQHLPAAATQQPRARTQDTGEQSCPGCMDTMPTHRHLLPRNFSCTAVLYGESPESPEDEDTPNGEEALEKSKEPSKPVTRGREVNIVPQSPTARRRAKSLPTPAERRHLEVAAPRKKEKIK